MVRKKKSSYANVVTSSRKEYAYDRPAVKCHCNKLPPRDTLWSDLNPGRRFYGCSDFRDGGCDFLKWYNGKMCDHATELLHELRDSERNLLKDNLALRKNVMDLVAFDGNHNGGSSVVDIEVEGGGREEPFACYFATWVLKKFVQYQAARAFYSNINNV
ncbi:hypothetical protein PVK06_001982 [Gossypium arboreum]|uniref:GRF-type domain-containing protein n=1 Tax=Gossypium arboreum TaxID=29729 RepID=A0ABR0R3F1_GOSAR|nr:hypothetical protein PVK06_001982 [Gossypium arboreum]